MIRYCPDGRVIQMLGFWNGAVGSEWTIVPVQTEIENCTTSPHIEDSIRDETAYFDCTVIPMCARRGLPVPTLIYEFDRIGEVQRKDYTHV